jgi:hypothetical protein
LALVVLSGVAAHAQTPALSEPDRIRIAEAFRLGKSIGTDLGPGATEIPFAILLVTPDREFLIAHPRPSSDFTVLGYDSLLGTTVHARPRQYSVNLLASFPAVGGISTIVVGQAESTRKSSTFWVLTVLHERFHQIQTSQNGYYDGVAKLDLANGDQSGQWMLQYPFPYDSARVVERFHQYRDALRRALSPSEDAERAMRDVLAARTALRAVLSPAEWRYLEFQLWQEGISRYTELRVARAAAEQQPLAAFAALPDVIPYAAAADSLRRTIERELSTLNLPGWKRVAFYPTGAAEGLLLDRVNQSWRSRYFTERFALELLYRK